MPATKFICPNGKRVRIGECLRSCEKRCMFLPTLRAVADSLDRNIAEPTVTELIAGVRETYLKKTSTYAVDPASILYALHGQAIHSINEQQTQGAILSEERLKDDITSGQFDLFGKILDGDDGVLGDLKVTSSFKLMKALGIYKVKVDTGEVYKSGLKKGQPKFKTELRFDGVRDLLDWAIQLNYYRLLLERAGFKISRMYIQAICRDTSLRIAAERGIDKPVYIHSYQQNQRPLANALLSTQSKAFAGGNGDENFAASLLLPRTLGQQKMFGLLRGARELSVRSTPSISKQRGDN